MCLGIKIRQKYFHRAFLLKNIFIIFYFNMWCYFLPQCDFFRFCPAVLNHEDNNFDSLLTFEVLHSQQIFSYVAKYLKRRKSRVKTLDPLTLHTQGSNQKSSYKLKEVGILRSLICETMVHIVIGHFLFLTIIKNKH